MLTDAVLLDISQAQRQIDQLEAELRRLSQPVRVPVDIEGEQAIAELRRDLQGADAGFGDLNAELAETDRELDRVRTSADRAGRELETTGRRGVASFNGLAVAAGAFGVAIAAAAGIRAFVGASSQAITAASNFEESLSKTNVVFGSLTGNIQKFANDAPRALGLSTAAALEATSTFGNLFVALGLTQEEAADLSPEIVQLAADLASFNNIEVGEAIEKLRSGLVGEAEPLRVLGVNINEATTKAKAFELGLVGVNGELSEAAKVQARYALILEQTGTAQGDFARTADGIANTQRTLSAEWENAKVVLGQALLPAYQQLLDILPGLIDQVEDLAPSVAALGLSLANAAEDSAPFLAFLLDVGRALPGVASAFGDIFTGDFLQAIDNLAVARLQTGFINDLREGVDPALALANALAELNRQTQSRPEDFQKFADQFIAIANLDPKRAAELGQQLRRAGIDAGFSAPQVQELREQLSGLVAESEGFSRRTPGGGRLPGTDPEDAANITATTGALGEFNVALESLSVQETVGQILTLTNSFTTLAPAVEDLPGVMGAVNDALQTEGDEVLETLDGFIEDLQTKFEEQNEFQGNLALLRALGLDDLADTFEAAGLDAAQALADAVADPEKAAEAERLIEAQAKTEAQLFKDTFNDTLSGFIATLPVDVILQQIQIPQIQAALNIGPIGGGTGVGDIITNFYGVTPQEVPTEAARAVQIINTGVNQSRTGPT